MRGTIRARGKGTWQVQVYAGRDPHTGRERRIARTIHGTKRDAERALARLITEVEAGQHRGDDPTVATLAEQWYTARSGSWSPRTRDAYRRELDQRIIPRLGHRKARTITARDLVERQVAEVAGELAGFGAEHPLHGDGHLHRRGLDPTPDLGHPWLAEGLAAHLSTHLCGQLGLAHPPPVEEVLERIPERLRPLPVLIAFAHSGQRKPVADQAV